MRVEEELIPIHPAIGKTVEIFDFDPFCAISEGTLILTIDKNEAADKEDFNKFKNLLDKNCHGFYQYHPRSFGNNTVNVVPLPSSLWTKILP
jgi:hypothetical protein